MDTPQLNLFSNQPNLEIISRVILTKWIKKPGSLSCRALSFYCELPFEEFLESIFADTESGPNFGGFQGASRNSSHNVFFGYFEDLGSFCRGHHRRRSCGSSTGTGSGTGSGSSLLTGHTLGALTHD